jgi:hypothetical protein
MLLSKALRMQEDLEDKKNKIIIEGLESKIKDCEASLEKKDFLLQATEGSLAEIQAENARLSEELLQSQTALKEKSESFEQEKKELQAKYEAEADKNTKLQKSLKIHAWNLAAAARDENGRKRYLFGNQFLVVFL